MNNISDNSNSEARKLACDLADALTAAITPDATGEEKTQAASVLRQYLQILEPQSAEVSQPASASAPAHPLDMIAKVLSAKVDEMRAQIDRTSDDRPKKHTAFDRYLSRVSEDLTGLAPSLPYVTI